MDPSRPQFLHGYDDPPTKDASELPDLPELSPTDRGRSCGRAVPGLSATGRGQSLIEASAPDRYVTQLDAEGFQVNFPATGDRGIDESLDTAARRLTPEDLQVTDPIPIFERDRTS
jgi:hypothetical protein